MGAGGKTHRDLTTVLENKIFCPGRQLRPCYPSHSESNHSDITFVCGRDTCMLHCVSEILDILFCFLTNSISKQTNIIYLSRANISSFLCKPKPANNSKPLVHILSQIKSPPVTQLPFCRWINFDITSLFTPFLRNYASRASTKLLNAWPSRHAWYNS